MTELVKTENLYTKKSSDGSQTLLEYFSSTLCKNNCSNNGICKSGVCKCASGFIGDDCSFDISKPPTDVILPLNGACKLRSRSCKTTNIFGEFLSTSVWCKRRHFEILQNDVLYTSGEDIVLATYRNSFMITLDIPAARKKRSTDNAILSDGYDISLSYDGQNFGEEIRIIIYDDLQYSCNATTQTCITLIVEEYSEKNETTKDTKDVMMIVIPITVSVVVIVVIAGVVCFKLKAKFSRKKIAAYKDEPDHKVTPSNNWKGQHSTSTIDFQCAEDTGVDSVAEQYPTQKENVDI